jgi:hypothetical protein
VSALRLFRFAGGAALLAGLLAQPGFAQEWLHSRIQVVPGKSVGPVKVGAKLSDEAKKFLGTSAKSAPPSVDTPGFAVFGKGDSRDLSQGIRLVYSDIKHPDVVTRIDLKGLRASTADGVFLGGAASLISSKFPDAQRDQNPFSNLPEWTMPGLSCQIKGDKISEFSVEDASRSQWRFLELSVVAGQSVGPVEVGKAPPADLFKQWGPPTFEQAPKRVANSGILRWSLPGQEPERLIEILLHDGGRPRVVTQIRVRGIKTITDKQIKLGDNFSLVKQLYPQGKEGTLSRLELDTWRIPGTTFVNKNSKIYEIQIFKASRAR